MNEAREPQGDDGAARRRQFMRHPSDMPISFRRRLDPGLSTGLIDLGQGGLSFHSERPFEPGDELEISIPVLDDESHFQGWVAWSRERADGYDIGVSFYSAEETQRVRMVEQLCRIEAYRQDVKAAEGRNLSSEEAAAEWIAKFAADFPDG